MKYKRLYAKAADIIEEKRAIAQGSFHKNGYYCAVGAMMAAAGLNVDTAWPLDKPSVDGARMKLAAHLGHKDDSSYVYNWNDELATIEDGWRTVVQTLRTLAYAP